MSPKLHPVRGIDGEATINLFVASLEDIRNPKHCPACLTGCLLAFFHNTNGAYLLDNIAILRENHHLFLDRCVAFLTLERDLAELDAASEEWIGCECDLNDALIRKLHDILPKGDEPDINTVSRHVVSVVHAVLQPVREKGGVHKVAHNAEKAAKQGKNVLWPTKPADLLPYGPDSSVRAMGYWIERAPSALWIGLVGSMLEICKRTMIPALITSPYIPEKSIGIVEVPIMVHMVRTAEPRRKSAATPAACLADVKRCAVFFLQLQTFCDRHELLKFFSGQEDFFFRAMKTALDFVRDIARDVKPSTARLDVIGIGETEQEVSYIESVFVTLAATVHCHLGLPFDSKKYTALVLAHSLAVLKTDKDPAIIAFQAFYQLAFHERCCSPGCTETFASLGRKFSLCSGCSRVPFCSKQCLTTAWKYPNVAHKDVCKKIKAVALATKLPSKPAPKDVLQFRDRCRAEIDEADIADIAMHVQRLFKEMSSAFDEEDKIQFLENVSRCETLGIEDVA
ncbi:hypothetical protein DFH07DRAFT_574171 [Mycena maculata]|uniref:MYND-type domain-containing protein n=1 Tax=Mycena maculata TaxID=230809 RepID=A0AAD7IRR8_9AGAR|nr:hypothetical protein DFH07DRAFT_574171 [Mycena maculata]